MLACAALALVAALLSVALAVTRRVPTLEAGTPVGADNSVALADDSGE